MPISELAVISGDNDNISAPAGFTRLPTDLNQGAGGKFIYLCYKESAAPPFVTDIRFVVSDKEGASAPPGYVRVEADLNQGAKGKFIYLCYLRGTAVPLLGLRIVTSDSAMPLLAQADGYTLIPQDLNEGAEGKFIYLCTTRQTATWMAQLGDKLADRPLDRITIPGTHDSATYSINEGSDFAPDSEAYAKYLKSLGRSVSDVSRAVVLKWARTQSRSILEQLQGGVRYLDIRVATCGGNDDDIRITHGLWGCSVNDVIAQVKSFVRSSPQEIVFLRFAYNEPGILSSGSKRSLLRRLFVELGEVLVPPTLGTHVTVGELWKTAGRVVVLLDSWIYDDGELTAAERGRCWKDGGNGSVVLKSTMASSGTMDPAKVKASAQTMVEQTWANPGCFQRLGLCLTPDLTYMGEQYVQGKFDASIYEDCARRINPAAVPWLRDDWAERIVNIFTVDFFQLGQCVDTAILRNAQPTRWILWTNLSDNFVLDVAGDNGRAGAQIISYPHKSSLSRNQLWILEASGHIRSALDPGLVLDVPGGSTAPGTQVILWTENRPATPNQRWTLDDKGYIRSALDPRLVLDVKGASKEPGTPIIIYPQGPTLSVNQTFRREAL